MNQPKSFIGFLRRSKKTILYIVVAVMITLAVVLATQWWLDPQGVVRFPSFGTLRIVDVKAYWDENHLNETKEISWGSIYTGSSYNTTFFLQSVSNVETTFEMTTGNWTFRDSHGVTLLGPVNKTSYMNLTWNYNGMKVNPRETVQITLTLTVADSSDFVPFFVNGDIKEFSVDITIRAV